MTFSDNPKNGSHPKDNFFLRLPLGKKISILSAVLVICIAAFIIIFLPLRKAEIETQSILRRANSIAKLCSSCIADSFAHANKQTVQFELEKLKKVDDILYIVICDQQDSIKQAVNFSTALHADYSTLENPADFDKLVAKSSFPVYSDNRIIGTLYLGLSLEGVQKEINNSRWIAVSVAFGILCLGLIIIWFTYKFISMPLDLFLHTVQAIASGAHGKRVPVVYNDEVGKLAAAFNALVDKLEDSNAELADLNLSLEEKVKERTKFLESEVERHTVTTSILKNAQYEIGQYREVFTEGPIVIIRLQADNGLLLDYTSENITQFGYFAWEILQEKRTLLSLAAKEDQIKIKEILAEQSYNTTSNCEFTFTLVKSDATRRYVYCYLAIQRNDFGKSVFFSGYLLDITGVKKTEQELLETQNRFKIVFEKNGLGIVLSNLKGEIFEANEAFQRFIGYTQEELATMRFQDISLPEDLAREMFAFRKGLIENQETLPICFEKRYVHKSGTIVWGRLTATFVKNTDDEVLFGLGMVEDITQEKATELLMQRQNKALKSAAKALTVMLKNTAFDDAINQVLEVLGRGIETDRAYLFVTRTDQQTGKELSSLEFEWCNEGIKKQINNAYWSGIDTSEYFTAWFSRLKLGGSINTHVKELQIKEKELLLNEQIQSVFLAPLFVNNTFWGVVGFDSCKAPRTMTEQEESILMMASVNVGSYIERYQAEAELFQAKEKAMESDRLKTTLLSNMSHEFRTPMNGILGYAAILADAINKPELKKIAKGIEYSGSRLLSTLDCILDLSQLESNKIQAHLQKAPLASIIKPLVKNSTTGLLERKLTLNFVINNYDLNVLVDPALLEKVFKHLFENAVKFTSVGSITITIDSCDENSAAWGCVHILDTGIGIAPENHKYIFDEFRQVSEGLGRGYEGSGLGLAVSSRMVKLMNGEIRLESLLGKGSKFSILLPAVNSNS